MRRFAQFITFAPCWRQITTAAPPNDAEVEQPVEEVVSRFKVHRDDVMALTKLIYHEHYRPAEALDGDGVDRDGWFSARAELRWIVEWAREHHHDPAEFNRAVKHAVLDRVDLHKPLSLVLGTQPFLGQEIVCRKGILIPRPETEHWVNWLVTRHWLGAPVLRPRGVEKKLEFEKQPDQERTFVIHSTKEDRPMEDPVESDADVSSPPAQPITGLRVLDLCCGTGCVGVSIAAKLPGVNVVCADTDPGAIQLTRENGERAKIDSKQLETIQSDMFLNFPETWKETFDCILCNPPYILPSQYGQLPRHITDWEDRLCLLGDDRHAVDALSYYQELCDEAWKWIKPAPIGEQPHLVMEVGLQADHVADLFDRSKAWRDVVVHTDLADQPRWICVRRS